MDRQSGEIKEALTKVRQEVRENVAAANAPKIAQLCPLCGATTTPNANGCCEFCGDAIQRKLSADVKEHKKITKELLWI